MHTDNDGKKDWVRRGNDDTANGGCFSVHAANLYRSPGHHLEGGSLAVILVVRSATRWLRL